MLKILDWNISYLNNAISKTELLQSIVEGDSFIIVLQEVTPPQFDVIKEAFPNIRYSLDYRKPGKYDTRQRKLGIAIIASNDISIENAGVLDRCILPDRTLLADLRYNNEQLSVLGLHSVTGVSHRKAKSIQFLSFAECIDEYKPDIVAFDANEPKKDHYAIEEMEFFDNGDNGKGARTFFETLFNCGLHDAYVANYDNSRYVEGEPLVISHKLSRGNHSRRYDFVFVNDRMKIEQINYKYDEAIIAGSDHALIEMCVGL